MDAVEIGDHANQLAGDEGVPLVEDDVDLLAPRASDHQRLGAGRLDDGDLDDNARSAGTEREVLRTDAVGDPPSVLESVRLRKGEA